MKKASVSVNVIILFVIGLLVLIVVVSLVVSNLNKGDKQLTACTGAPGLEAQCVPEGGCPPGKRYVMGDSECNPDNQICCVT